MAAAAPPRQPAPPRQTAPLSQMAGSARMTTGASSTAARVQQMLASLGIQLDNPHAAFSLSSNDDPQDPKPAGGSTGGSTGGLPGGLPLTNPHAAFTPSVGVASGDPNPSLKNQVPISNPHAAFSQSASQPSEGSQLPSRAAQSNTTPGTQASQGLPPGGAQR